MIETVTDDLLLLPYQWTLLQQLVKIMRPCENEEKFHSQCSMGSYFFNNLTTEVGY